jgi:hypothetical protein
MDFKELRELIAKIVMVERNDGGVGRRLLGAWQLPISIITQTTKRVSESFGDDLPPDSIEGVAFGSLAGFNVERGILPAQCRVRWSPPVLPGTMVPSRGPVGR